MDKTETRPVKSQSFAWVKAAMPRVADMVARERQVLGDDWVNECWKRGMQGEPGWFFAREGAVSIGTPFPSAMFPNAPVLDQWLADHLRGTCLVLIRRKGEADA